MDRNRVLAILLLISISFDVSNASIFLRSFRKFVAATPSDNSTATATTPQIVAPLPSPAVNNNTLDPKPNEVANNSNVKNRSEAPEPPGNLSKSHHNVSSDPKLTDNSTKVDPGGSKNASAPEVNQNSTGHGPTIGKDEAKGSNETLNSVSPPTAIQTDSQKGSDKDKRKDETKGSDDAKSSVNSPAVNQTDVKKSDEKSKEVDDKSDSQAGNGHWTCDGSVNRCRDRKALVACVESFNSGTKELVALVQNEGDDELKVNLAGLPSTGNNMRELVLAKHQIRRINVSLGESSKLVLDAGNGKCTLRTLQTGPPVSAGNFYINLPSYDQLLTPINGAYLLIVTVFILGGMWACCKFRKRQRHGGVPYQELEMAMPESNLANVVDTAEGWDDDWDDDWDEEKAVRSPGGHRVGSISANGLTSRTSNKDGWENDWDD